MVKRKTLWKRLLAIAIVAALAGLINGIIIFKATHNFGYAKEVVPAIMAMNLGNESLNDKSVDKIIIVNSERDYEWFKAYAKDYEIYKLGEFMADGLAESLERAWFVFDTNDAAKPEDPNDLVPGFYSISEIIGDGYAAFELEKVDD